MNCCAFFSFFACVCITLKQHNVDYVVIKSGRWFDMLTFDLYCNLVHEAQISINKKNKKNNDFALLFADNQSEDAFWVLIQNCDKETLDQLKNYFPSDAPVQELLKKRLIEIEKQQDKKELNENDVEEYKSLTKIKPSFYKYLADTIESKGYTEPEFYNYIGMSRQTFGKIRKYEKISRNHILLMAVGLELDYNEAVHFMAEAGFVFRPSDNRESFISYVMRNKKYTLESMEEMLFFMGEKPLMDV